MTRTLKLAALLPLFAAPALAQQNTTDSTSGSAAKASNVPPIVIQNIRPTDQRGLNMFEAPKNDGIPFTGFRLGWGAAFTQAFQGLRHENTATGNQTAGSATQLTRLGNGFNNATANLYLNAQVADGIRVALTTYLSSRHHNETWVKDGYFLIDKSPIENAMLNRIMQYTTLKVGHFEINYGDQHFRRTDNGQGIYNPFVGNMIMDAFTTEIGGEVYFRTGPWLAMAGVTNGEIKGGVQNPQRRAPSFLGKVGYDNRFSDDFRVRLTGSTYNTYKSQSNTLYSGDRAGSRYYSVMENQLPATTEAANAWSAAIRPGFGNKVVAYVVNPFIQYKGFEFFGNIETSTGRAATETKDRTWRQNAADLVYRFGAQNQFFVAGRYNTASGTLQGIANQVSVDRQQYGLGWFVTPVVLAKAEWMSQRYNDFPSADIRNGGRINGFMIEGTVAF